MPTMKECTKCGVPKPRDEFSKDRSRKDKKDCWCKQCRREYRKKYYAEHAEEAREAAREWRESNHEQYLETKRRYREAHPEAVSEGKKKWYREMRQDPEALEDWRQMQRRSSRKRRARKADNGIIEFSDEELDAKLDYWAERCWMCGADMECVDHVKPIAAGGMHALCNLRPACNECNESKSDKWPFVLEGDRDADKDLSSADRI